MKNSQHNHFNKANVLAAVIRASLISTSNGSSIEEFAIDEVVESVFPAKASK
ncbi:MAG: hypothetical protein R3Y27_08415 [Clostridia bacterium]